MNKDCTLVNRSIRLDDFRRWKSNSSEPMPFYLQTADGGGVFFSGNPETVRQLLRSYNAQRLFYHLDLVSFLNAEGIEARKVSVRIEGLLAYKAETSPN